MGSAASEKMGQPLSVGNPEFPTYESQETPTERWAGRILSFLKNPQSTPNLPETVFHGDLQAAPRLFLENVAAVIRKSDPTAQFINENGSLTYRNVTITTSALAGSSPQEVLITGKISKRQ